MFGTLRPIAELVVALTQRSGFIAWIRKVIKTAAFASHDFTSRSSATIGSATGGAGRGIQCVTISIEPSQ
jgi:hypothetical protein